LARHKDPDECLKFANEKKDGKLVYPFNYVLSKHTNKAELLAIADHESNIKITHYGMRRMESRNSYNFSFTSQKGHKVSKFIVESKNYWKCVAAVRKIIQEKIDNQESVDPFVGEDLDDIEESKKYDGIYKNKRKNMWYSFGYIADRKLVLAFDTNEDTCKTKLDERIELEKNTNNNEVFVFDEWSRKKRLTSSKLKRSQYQHKPQEFIKVKFTNDNTFKKITEEEKEEIFIQFTDQPKITEEEKQEIFIQFTDQPKIKPTDSIVNQEKESLVKD
jgi:hypothetical protein